MKDAKKDDFENSIFALDIGTRSIIGIVAKEDKEKGLRVLAAETIEHESRAMVDGQIHDISKVAHVSTKVKENLENQLGISLKKVAVAAAGRVLKTYETYVEKEVISTEEIQKEQIQELELEGIHEAKLMLQRDLQNEEDQLFFCVGYSVVNYYLNGMMIANLEGHKGKKIGIKMISTFLPHVVVDSLYTAMKKTGLEVQSLTLEPIAASQIAIPENLRLLNLALVDIGAGTSDIAITKDGTIVAYDMVSIAGDEITEKIVHSYLVDFNTAEKIKVSLKENDTIEYTDILGMTYKISKEEVLQNILPTLEELAETIANKLIETNGGKSPNAVFCIGGGGQVPGFDFILASKLKLPKERVVIRGTEMLQDVTFDCPPLKGPQFVTPLGIAKTASEHVGYEFMYITLNQEVYKVMNSTKTTIGDLAIMAGFTPKDLLFCRGEHLIFFLNEKQVTIKGEYGIPAVILCNGKECSLETVLGNGDKVEIKPAKRGKNAEAKLDNYIQSTDKKTVTFQGNSFDISTKIMKNGESVSLEYKIRNGDRIYLLEIHTLKEFFDFIELQNRSKEVFVNNQKVSLDYVLKDGDSISIEEKEVQNKDILKNNFIEIEDNTEEVEATEEKDIVEKPMNTIEVTVNGQPVILESERKSFIFVDVFNFIDFDLNNPKGSIVLLLNGKKAGFTDRIYRGDDISIYWDIK